MVEGSCMVVLLQVIDGVDGHLGFDDCVLHLEAPFQLAAARVKRFGVALLMCVLNLKHHLLVF